VYNLVSRHVFDSLEELTTIEISFSKCYRWLARRISKL